jgi:hypothetical protein
MAMFCPDADSAPSPVLAKSLEARSKIGTEILLSLGLNMPQSSLQAANISRNTIRICLSICYINNDNYSHRALATN